MVATGRILVAASVVFVVVVVCARISRAQTGVCYRGVTRYTVSYRTTTSYYSTDCGLFGWRRCRRTRYGRESYIQSYNVNLFECCTGYTTCGPNSNSCCKNANCTTGDMRLVGGSSPLEGRVEVCYYNQWGTVCDNSWGMSDAQVVCRQLGYSSTSATAYSGARFGEGTGPIVMDDVRCTGSEGRLMDCPLSLSHNCGHYEDAGVQCTLVTYGCTSGDVRLAGSSSSSTQGRVELCHNNQWGTICDDNWDNNNAEVICKQLKYSSYGALGESNAIFGQGSGSIWLSNVGCNGMEERLLDCSTDAFGSHTCSHSEDAGVTCNTTCTDGDLRLSGGRNGTEGRVEMCSRSEWGTVCGDLWDEVDAQVVCNQLGFSNTGAIVISSFIGGTGSILLDDIDCIGNESRLIDCSHNGLGVHNCTHADDAGVRCLRLSSDINECEENTDGCAQTCTDTESSYICSCLSGYRLANDRHGCDDINECRLNTDSCAHICTNTIGSYTCRCRTGFSLAANRHSCEDINECVLNTDGCAHNCSNTIGSYTCSCRTGYRLAADGRSCEDINECSLDMDGCAHICTNTVGSYTCSCGTGYRLSSNERTCQDINECTETGAGCGQQCFNTIGSYNCGCLSGYRLHSDRHTCNDINECTEGSDGCAQTCTNIVSSYTCSCDPGYRLASDGRTCNDVDECSEGISGCAHTCTNTIGSYQCSCSTGFVLSAGDEHGCEDINECGNDTLHVCEQVCNNTHGSHNCLCFDGYELDIDGFSCTNIDECAEDIDGCTQTCTNTVGSYTCSCSSGYRLAGDNHGCNDVNECAEGQDDCHQQAHTVCSNTVGSYTCDCQTGYRLNGRTCTDIDECMVDNVCDHSCTNTEGSFVCDCRSGFSKTLNEIGCLGSPGNVSLNARSSRSLSLTWTSPANLKEKHGSFVAYSVKCWSKGQITAAYKLENVTQVIIDQCLPFSTYNCCVSLQTTQANSTAMCQQQRTPEDAPESPPMITSIDNSNPYSIVVYWSPPLRSNGVVTRYTLYIGYETQSGVIDVFITDGQSTSYNVSNLLPYQQISIEVTASTRIGEGPSSVHETRTAQAPPQEVTQVVVDVISDSRIQVQWGPPARSNGILTYYTITVFNQQTGFNFSSQINASAAEVITVGGLSAFIPYIVQVFASTEAGRGNPATSLVYTRHGVPAIPTLTSVSRLSRSSAVINWIPLTHAEAKGLLTSLEIAYEPVVDSDCSSYNFMDSETIFMTENLFEQSTANITGLEPNREYCIAIQVSTSGGESGFSNIIKLPLPRGVPFQIKFELPDESVKCSNFVEEDTKEKTARISQFLAQQIAQLCQCQYSSSFIIDSQFLCTTKNDVIYQAKFLPSDSKTALEARNTTQLWILTKSIIVIDNQFYRVDPYCSIIVEELGMTSCDSNPSTEALLTNQKPSFGESVIELVSVIGAGVLLVLVIVLVIILVLCCVCRRKSKSTKSNDIGRSLQQQTLDNTLPQPPKEELKCKDNEMEGFENPLYHDLAMTTSGRKYTENIYESLDPDD